jgi:hypothetical protein
MQSAPGSRLRVDFTQHGECGAWIITGKECSVCKLSLKVSILFPLFSSYILELGFLSGSASSIWLVEIRGKAVSWPSVA